MKHFSAKNFYFSGKPGFPKPSPELGNNALIRRFLSKNGNLVLQDVLLVPDFKVNLLLVNKLILDNCCTVKFNKTCIVQDLNHKVLLETEESRDGLFSTRQIVQLYAHSVNKSISDLLKP